MITGSVDALRRLVQEPSTSGTYTNSVLSDYLGWAGGDMYGAGYMIWSEKLASFQLQYNYAADGENFQLQQQFENAKQMQSLCSSLRGAKSVQLVKDPPETEDEEELQ